MVAKPPVPQSPGSESELRVSGAGVGIACEVRGTGSPVLLLHGATGGRAGVAELAALLAREFRVVAPDRRGWGASETPESYTGTSVEEHGEDAAAILRVLDAAPAVVCGDGFGALVCIDLMLRHPALVHAAVLVEPPLGWLSRRGPEATAELRAAVEEAVPAGGPGAAADAYLEWVAGDGRAALGPERTNAVRQGFRSLFAELAGTHAFSLRPPELGATGVPLAVVWGASGTPLLREVGAALCALVPTARAVEVDGASPVAISNPGAVARCVREMAG